MREDHLGLVVVEEVGALGAAIAIALEGPVPLFLDILQFLLELLHLHVILPLHLLNKFLLQLRRSRRHLAHLLLLLAKRQVDFGEFPLLLSALGIEFLVQLDLLRGECLCYIRGLCGLWCGGVLKLLSLLLFDGVIRTAFFLVAVLILDGLCYLVQRDDQLLLIRRRQYFLGPPIQRLQKLALPSLLDDEVLVLK